MRIGRHESYRLRFEIDINAVHHRTQFVIGRGENRFVDPYHQRIDIQRKALFGFGVQLGQVRITQPRSAGERQLAALPAYDDLPGGFVRLDSQRLFGKLFERIEHQLHRYGDQPFTLHVFDRERSHQSGLEVGSGDFQHALFQVEKKIIQNGQRILAADYLIGRLEQAQQGR